MKASLHKIGIPRRHGKSRHEKQSTVGCRRRGNVRQVVVVERYQHLSILLRHEPCRGGHRHAVDARRERGAPSHAAHESKDTGILHPHAAFNGPAHDRRVGGGTPIVDALSRHRDVSP